MCVCFGLGLVGYCVCVVCYNNLCVYLNCKLPWPRLVILTMTCVCVCVCVCSCFGIGLVGYCVCCVLLYVFASMVSRLGLGLGWLD